MRLPVLPKIAARSGTSTKGPRTANVVSDKGGILQSRPGLALAEVVGCNGNGLLDTPNGLFSVWCNVLVDDAGGARILDGSGAIAPAIFAGWTDVYITGMSDDGQVCSGYGNKTGTGIRAIKLTKTTLTELTLPSGVTTSRGYSISGDGLTIVGSGYVGGTGVMRAYKWVNTTATQITLADGAGDLGGAFATNYDGTKICGHLLRGGVVKGFISTNEVVSYPTLAYPYTSTSEFFSMSSDGQYVGGRAVELTSGQTPPILYDGTTVTAVYSGASGVVTGISSNGEFSCGIRSSSDDGFFYQKTGAVLTDMDSGSTQVIPYAIAKRGHAVVGERCTSGGTVSMFRWTPGVGFENMGRILQTITGTGPAGGSQVPKYGGCSALGTTIAVTQFNVASRTPAFWTPTA